MNVAQSIEPNVGETVIWRHSGAIPPRSDKEVSRLKWVYVIISLVWLAFWFSRPSTREALLSKNAYIVSLVFFVSVILISLALASVIIWRKNRRVKHHVNPVWMSDERLVFLDELGVETALELEDVHEATSDYIMGSPALILISKGKTLKLMSSEVSQLRDKLFTLRPDLKLSS